MSNLAVYIIGALLVAGGFGYAAHLIGLGPVWIVVIGVIILGFGIMGGVKKTRETETSPKDE